MSAASEITPEAALLPPRAQAALTHVEAIAASRRQAMNGTGWGDSGGDGAFRTCHLHGVRSASLGRDPGT